MHFMDGRALLQILLVMLSLSSCAVFNPNPGENEADALISQKKYSEALEIIEPAASNHYPWAMLRLGIAYEYGQGKTRSYSDALLWYKKTAKATEESAWGDGLTLLSGGDKGFFNRNNDAKVAQYLIARIYAQGSPDVEKNIPEAWLWANYVHRQSDGSDILFCCENSRLETQKIEFARIDALLKKIESSMTADELGYLKENYSQWRPY